ncbi:hypothetical protein LIER_15399 [Lithospermum erythrorhizon]|uniref:Protein PHYTOCHROME KINASE SUBSTRATE 1-like n=1 Tax=Lithospermum erythrorhizon TaxID=34254 RepID=A0AAV3Q2P1_LITER
MSSIVTFGDASFSSYLNGAEESFVLQLTKSRHNSFSFQHNGHIQLGRNKSENGEIDVFGAERYFNEPFEEHDVTQKFMNKKDDPHEAESCESKLRPKTPSVRSESSCNSRNLLLNVPTPQQTPKGESCRKSFLARLGWHCSCNDGSAIDVSNSCNQGESRKGAKNGDMKQFGRTDSNIWLKEDKGEFARERSVDVYGPPLQKQGDKASSLEREVKMLAWDAINKRVQEIGIAKCPNEEYNDKDSETSSDLFEIESFSTNYTNPQLVRQASDRMSGCITPISCYAPSEASVQWSTVTASMADFSVMSDSEELEAVPARTSRSRKVRDGRNTQTRKQMTSKLPGILSGCKNHKAVKVAGEAYRASERANSDLQRQQRMETIKPMKRFQSESKQTGLQTINSRRFNTIPLSESQFKLAPHMLYMH